MDKIKVKTHFKVQFKNKIYQCKSYFFDNFKLSITSLGKQINNEKFIEDLIIVLGINDLTNLTNFLLKYYDKVDWRIGNSKGWN